MNTLPLKTLIVEDDVTSCKILQKFLKDYAECDVAVNGLEALEIFKSALTKGQPYQLVCLDIMMPEMDGHSVLKRIREHEQVFGIQEQSGVKIIMTTALDDIKNVLGSFKSGCEAYLVKPINKELLLHELRKLGLIS